jgi:type III restriction enzyme
MLQEIIDLQQLAVERLVVELKKKNEITFKAPTGSGKTYMMADFMSRVLAEYPNVIFLVSSLSKGNLARQNYEKFVEYKSKSNFPNLNPYLINSNIAGEERLYIPTEYNVYLLPRDLYKKGGRLMQGGMSAFLEDLVWNGKIILLIKDECHIATNNLDSISKSYFYKIINFSATPKLARGQHPDVEIKNEDAENVNLIKTIEWGEESDTIVDVVAKFEEIKEDYRNFLNVNPCLIIQISNKDKADEELKNKIMPALTVKPEIKWMLIVDKDKDCDTNDVFKAKKLPVTKWKDYAKENTASIDVIIFKMVITEGWDIPRACMLYQVRDTQSKQLDEQVIGRVRRNPRLLDFENLSDKAKQLAMSAWIWGVKSEEQKKVFGVKLWDEPQETINNIKIKVTKLKSLIKTDFNLNTFLSKQEEPTTHKSIFDIARQLRQVDNQIRDIVYDYATDFSKWWEIAEFVPELEKENNQYLCDYEQSMEIKEEVSFALSSHYTDNGNYENIEDWVWKRRNGADKFSFDSEAERSWANILKKLSPKTIKPLTVGRIKKNDLAGQKNLFGETENDAIIDEKEIYLWGKNYVSNSAIKFEYYLGALHSSFPDFVMKDCFGRIHIFEVKSVNQSDEYSFDNNIYKTKIAELKKCYKQASVLTEQIFYLPVLNGEEWQITRFYRGDDSTLSFDEFKSFVSRPSL